MFIAKFECLFYKAKKQNWPKTNKVSVLCNILNAILHSHFMQQFSLFCKYDEFVVIVQQLANCFSAFSVFFSTNPAVSAFSVNHSQSPPICILYNTQNQNLDVMDVNNININAIDDFEVDQKTQMMLISLHPAYNHNQTAHTSEKLHRAQRKRGHYIHCGNLNYWVQDCPKHPYLNKREFNQRSIWELSHNKEPIEQKIAYSNSEK